VEDAPQAQEEDIQDIRKKGSTRATEKRMTNDRRDRRREEEVPQLGFILHPVSTNVQEE